MSIKDWLADQLDAAKEKVEPSTAVRIRVVLVHPSGETVGTSSWPAEFAGSTFTIGLGVGKMEDDTESARSRRDVPLPSVPDPIPAPVVEVVEAEGARITKTIHNAPVGNTSTLPDGTVVDWGRKLPKAGAFIRGDY